MLQLRVETGDLSCWDTRGFMSQSTGIEKNCFLMGGPLLVQAARSPWVPSAHKIRACFGGHFVIKQHNIATDLQTQQRLFHRLQIMVYDHNYSYVNLVLIWPQESHANALAQLRQCCIRANGSFPKWREECFSTQNINSSFNKRKNWLSLLRWWPQHSC